MLTVSAAASQNVAQSLLKIKTVILFHLNAMIYYAGKKDQK